MQLYAVKEMLPFFAGTVHNLYLKSAYTYLQQMQTMEIDHSDRHPFEHRWRLPRCDVKKQILGRLNKH